MGAYKGLVVTVLARYQGQEPAEPPSLECPVRLVNAGSCCIRVELQHYLQGPKRANPLGVMVPYGALVQDLMIGGSNEPTGGWLLMCLVAKVYCGPDWGLKVRLGGSGARWVPVRSRRERLRTFTSLTTVGRFVQNVGLRDFNVELRPALLKLCPRWVGRFPLLLFIAQKRIDGTMHSVQIHRLSQKSRMSREKTGWQHGVARHDDHRQVRPAKPYCFNQIQTVEPSRHVHVCDDQSKVHCAFQRPQGVICTRAFGNGITKDLHCLRHHRAKTSVVLDEENIE